MGHKVETKFEAVRPIDPDFSVNCGSRGPKVDPLAGAGDFDPLWAGRARQKVFSKNPEKWIGWSPPKHGACRGVFEKPANPAQN